MILLYVLRESNFSCCSLVARMTTVTRLQVRLWHTDTDTKHCTTCCALIWYSGVLWWFVPVISARRLHIDISNKIRLVVSNCFLNLSQKCMIYENNNDKVVSVALSITLGENLNIEQPTQYWDATLEPLNCGVVFNSQSELQNKWECLPASNS